jgi:8-oxo-dGTP pyrophosphatase MutT (NUDIX family)
MGFEYTDKKLAAGIIPICKNTGRILLCRRNYEGSFPGHWSLFGGTFEEVDRMPKETAKREFSEETKYDKGYSISSSPIDTNSNNFVTYYTYVGLFDDEFEPYVNGCDENSQENVDYGWFNLDCLPDGMIPDLEDTFEKKNKLLTNIIAKCGK